MRGDLQKLLLGRIFMIDSSFSDSGFRIPGRIALNSDAHRFLSTKARTELLTVADKGIKRMANSIHPRNHQPPVYEMDRVTQKPSRIYSVGLVVVDT